jgi:hypothetical protein
MAEHRMTRKELPIWWLFAMLVVLVVVLVVAAWLLVASVDDLAVAALPASGP